MLKGMRFKFKGECVCEREIEGAEIHFEIEEA